MEELAVYADATALIGLARIDRLDLLLLLPQPVLVTAQVWVEVTGDPEKPGVRALPKARREGLLSVVEEGDPSAFPQLDDGESTVLSAAAAATATVLIDERKARVLIKTDPELRKAIRQPIGIIGLILLAKRRKHIAAIRPLLDELIRQDFWIAPTLYAHVLREAGETLHAE